MSRPPWKKTNYKADRIREAKEQAATIARRKKARKDVKEGKQETLWQSYFKQKEGRKP